MTRHRSTFAALLALSWPTLALAVDYPGGDYGATIALLVGYLVLPDALWNTFLQAKQAADRWRETFGTETEEQAEERRYQNRSFRMTAPCDGQMTINATLPGP